VAVTFIANRSNILCATNVRETHIFYDKPISIQLIKSACRNVLPTVLRPAIRRILINVLLSSCLQLCGVISRQAYISQFSRRNYDIHLFLFVFPPLIALFYVFFFFREFFISCVQYNLRCKAQSYIFRMLSLCLLRLCVQISKLFAPVSHAKH
jgi:hypothetical protein